MPPLLSVEPFQVLVVCTANHCRSPLAEFTLRRLVHRAGLPWSVSSAGTLARPGLPPHPHVRRLLREHDDAIDGWRSRTVDVGLIDAADLILVADLENRNRVVRASPSAAPRTFMLLQLAAYCRHPAATPARSGQTVRSWVVQAREALPRTEGRADLADPVGAPFSRFRHLDAQVVQASSAIVDTHAALRR